VVNSRLQVPRYEDEKLEASSLILADQIEHVPAKQIGSGQFVLGSSKVRPPSKVISPPPTNSGFTCRSIT